MRVMHQKSEIAQLTLNDLGRGDHTKAYNPVHSHPFFNRSRAGRLRRNQRFRTDFTLSGEGEPKPTTVFETAPIGRSGVCEVI